MTHFKLLVPNAMPEGQLAVHAAFDEQPIATIDYAGYAAVERALATAHETFQQRDKWLKPFVRVAILEKALKEMQAQAEFLALEAAREGGKPLRDSRVEIHRAIDGVRSCIEGLRTNQGDVIPMGVTPASDKRVAFTRKEPIGPVVAVSAFNHPLNLIIHQVAPAIATGCPVIIKPATDTPLSCMRLVEIFYQAGLPVEWCQALVVKDRDVATKLVIDERVAFFSFIGSASVGWKLRSQLAPGTRCALEHGGVAPVIVAKDACLDKVVPALTKGGFYHSGQVCVSVQRVFVHQSLLQALAQAMQKSAQNLVVGDPTQETTDLGPLIRCKEVDRVEAWVDEAVAQGATLLLGGKRISNTCYMPTLLLNPPLDAKVSQAEIFGPVICLYGYEEMQEALNKSNALPVAFQAAIFTESVDEALYAYSRLNASAVMLNDHTAFRADWMPFAGLRHSGLGVGGIPYTMHDMQVDKLLVLHSESIS